MDLSNSKEDQRFTIKVDGHTFHIDPKEPIPMSLTQRAGRIDGGKKKSEKVCHIICDLQVCSILFFASHVERSQMWFLLEFWKCSLCILFHLHDTFQDSYFSLEFQFRILPPALTRGRPPSHSLDSSQASHFTYSLGRCLGVWHLLAPKADIFMQIR